jgi:Stress responsive A/B Barrel Domain
MISHVVLFRPRPTIGPAERAAIAEHLKTAIVQCPTVRGCRVGRRVQHGLAGYEQQMAEDYQFALILDFDNVEGLLAYLQHPAHAGIGGLFTSAASASLAYDYEVVDLKDAAQLL